MSKLSLNDIILLGMTNFALYVGAGNIIFPPIIGMQAGHEVTIAGIGFLITGVGLPVIAAIAMAKVGGALQKITLPVGVKIGLILTVACYLCIGPLFAIPRTATVAFELAISPFTTAAIKADAEQKKNEQVQEAIEENAKNNLDSSVENEQAISEEVNKSIEKETAKEIKSATTKNLLIFSIIYFLIVAIFSLYPAKILDTVGKFLSPIKIVSLLILCLTALFFAPSEAVAPMQDYKDNAFAQGIVNGYLTLDTMASLAFGIVIVHAINSRGVTDSKLVTKYAVFSGLIAGIGLTLIYICLFKLGNESYDLAPNATNGAEILSAYVQHTFGYLGSLFLAILIIVACLVTAIGLICACGSYFSQISKFNYKTIALTFCLFSAFVSNLGLTGLIQISVPVLIAIYPVFIVLVLASFIKDLTNNSKFVIAPVAGLAMLFGVIDGLKSAGFDILPTSLSSMLPMYSSNLAWLIPCTILITILFIVDKVKGIKE